jgi:subtilisin family serine protease
VVDQLRSTADRTQARVRAYLKAEGIPYQSFWIDNVILVPSTTERVLDDLTAFEEIELLRADREMRVIEPVSKSEAAEVGRSVEPNISHVKADLAWALGIDGAGMVVAGIDTGVRFTHEAIEPHYRGNLGGGTFDHDYNWLSGDGGSATPVDGHGHGTHTMGTMIGDDGGANQIGMAPGATWIACEGCPNGSCPASALLTCAQWVAAPYPIGDPGLPDPSKRPHVVNNSWGDCDQSYDGWFQGVVDSWHAAGVYPVFANVNASNCGYAYPPGCNTVGNPGRYGNVTGVGSTGQSNGAYAPHSNWGPTDNLDTVNPNGFPTVKPQVVAPGVDIRSSLSGWDSQYGSWAGTSMSAPHVAGLIALMWQAAPCLIADYAATESILQASAAAIPYPTACGGEGPGNIPNMATGWGEIDALEAVAQAAAFCGTSWVLFTDDFENGTTDGWSSTNP